MEFFSLFGELLLFCDILRLLFVFSNEFRRTWGEGAYRSTLTINRLLPHNLSTFGADDVFSGRVEAKTPRPTACNTKACSLCLCMFDHSLLGNTLVFFRLFFRETHSLARAPTHICIALGCGRWCDANACASAAIVAGSIGGDRKSRPSRSYLQIRTMTEPLECVPPHSKSLRSTGTGATALRNQVDNIGAHWLTS